MQSSAVLFLTFCRKLLGKWSVWVFAAVDIVGAIVLIAFPHFAPPALAFILVTFIGLFWASYQVFKEVNRLLPNEKQDAKTSKLLVQLLEGNQYEYAIDRPATEALDQYSKDPSERTEQVALLPKSSIVLKLRLENVGDLPVDILNIQASIDMTKPLQFMVPIATTNDGSFLKFPIHVDAGDVISFKMFDHVFPWSLHSPAQITAGMSEVLRKHVVPVGNIQIDSIDSTGKRFGTELKITIEVRPLFDIYINYWKSIDALDLVRLSKPK